VKVDIPTLYDWLRDVEEDGLDDHLFEGLVPEESIILLSGQQKATNKSMTALAMSLSLASGNEVAIFKPNRKDKVLYVLEEGGRTPTYFRARALARGLDIDEEAYKNIYWMFRNRFRVGDAKWNKQIAAICKKLKPGLVVLDSLFKMCPGLNENAAEDMAKVVETMDIIRDCGPSVMFITHVSKNKPKTDCIDDQVRGSSVLVNSYDVHMGPRWWGTVGTGQNKAKNDDPTIDLTILSRDGEEQNYLINWEFETKPQEVKGRQAVRAWRAYMHCQSVEKVKPDAKFAIKAFGPKGV